MERYRIERTIIESIDLDAKNAEDALAQAQTSQEWDRTEIDSGYGEGVIVFKINRDTGEITQVSYNDWSYT